DVPINVLQIPFLPDEIVMNILLRLDALSILACRSTCRHWRQKLSSYEFLMELAKKWYARGSFIFAHFGYSMTEHISVDWILKLDAISGEVIPFQFPFSFTYE
ncbi:hypothetical protein PIB30_113334, partial [Stylosanthes scabra]|nr:hypothetical protein [Stylosanthes scabra]